MNPDEVRKKKLEEIESKKKRLEEMRKSRNQPPAVTLIEKKTESASEPSTILYSEPILTPSNDSISTPLKLSEKVKFFGYVRSPQSVIRIESIESVKYNQTTQTEDDLELDSDRIKNTTPIIENTKFHSPGKVPMFALENVDKQLPSSPIDSLIFSETKFIRFLSTASLRIERELEYLNTFNNLKNISTEENSNNTNKNYLFSNSDGYDDEFLKERPVLFLHSSPQFPRSFLTCHGRSPGVDNIDATGLVCIWSRDIHKRPELKYSSHSIVNVAIFHFDSSSIFGGCQNGQILMWDLRSTNSQPIQKTSLIGNCHKYPIQALSMQNGLLVSLSVDGTICQWDVLRLSEPVHIGLIGQALNRGISNTENNFLFSPQAEKQNVNSLNVTSMSLLTWDAKLVVLIGTGLGTLFRVPLPYRLNDSKFLQVSVV